MELRKSKEEIGTNLGFPDFSPMPESRNITCLDWREGEAEM